MYELTGDTVSRWEACTLLPREEVPEEPSTKQILNADVKYLLLLHAV